jgi:hypothetical protein
MGSSKSYYRSEMGRLIPAYEDSERISSSIPSTGEWGGGGRDLERKGWGRSVCIYPVLTQPSASVSREASILQPRSNLKAYHHYCNLPRLIWECDADDKVGIKEFWRQFNIKMTVVIRLPF